ncbi:hypothetical protein GmHk_05G013050 [Glycine max]|nr:hypothetical protein GmHk_05G013050 [Glycine max]
MNFDDVKEESNKAATKDKHCFKINTRLFQQTKPLLQDYFKIKPCLKTKCFQDMQGSVAIKLQEAKDSNDEDPRPTSSTWSYITWEAVSIIGPWHPCSRNMGLQLQELGDICLEAYENSNIYKEKVKRFHDSRFLRKEFHIGKVSQPTLQREADARLTGAPSMGGKMRGVATNVYSRKTSEKSETCGLRTLIMKGSGVVFTHGEGISTPRVRHKGQQPLIKCPNMTSKWCFPRSYIF